MTRSEAREVAFLLVYEWSFRPDEELDTIVECAVEARQLKADTFAKALAKGTITHSAQLDEMIEGYSQRWKLNRLSRVVLAVLRISFCQLLYFTDIPVGAAINEAVELVKKYATEDESAYVNGILGAFSREEKQQAGGGEA